MKEPFTQLRGSDVALAGEVAWERAPQLEAAQCDKSTTCMGEGDTGIRRVARSDLKREARWKGWY